MWNWSESPKPNNGWRLKENNAQKNVSDFEKTLLKLLLSHHPILENKPHEIMPGQASIMNSTQLKK